MRYTTLLLVVLVLALQVTVGQPIAFASNQPDSPSISENLETRMDRLGEQLELLLSTDGEKPRVKFSHAYERLIEAKDLWVSDQDEAAKARLQESWSEFQEGVEISRTTIGNSEALQDLREIGAKVEREAQEFLASQNERIDEFKTRLQSLWID